MVAAMTAMSDASCATIVFFDVNSDSVPASVRIFFSASSMRIMTSRISAASAKESPAGGSARLAGRERLSVSETDSKSPSSRF